MGDEEGQTVVVVDPRRNFQQYLADAGRQDLHIRRVFLTNFHADFLAGHLELREGRVVSAGRAQDSWGDGVSRLNEMTQAAEELSHKRLDVDMDYEFTDGQAFESSLHIGDDGTIHGTQG